MAKTTFGPGVIVTSKWLNGAKEIKFDGQDKDWHYALNSIVNVTFSVADADGIDTLLYVTVEH